MSYDEENEEITDYYDDMIPAEQNDTTLRMKLDEYLNIVKELGFDLLMKDKIENEDLYVFGREKGSMILVIDSYEDRRNQALIQFRIANIETQNNALDVCDVRFLTSADENTAAYLTCDVRKSLKGFMKTIDKLNDELVNYWCNKSEDKIYGDIFESAYPWLIVSQDYRVYNKTHVIETLEARQEMFAAITDLNEKRVEMLPPEWKDRLDTMRNRSIAEAYEMNQNQNPSIKC